MRVLYTGTSDQRIISSVDFPDIQLDFEADVDRVEWVWPPGGVVDVPFEVGERLTQLHRHEFKEILDPDEVQDEPELTEDEVEVVEQDDEAPSRQDMVDQLRARSRAELTQILRDKEIAFDAKASKTTLVDLIMTHYDSISDQSLDDDPVDPDSELDSP